MKKEGAGFLSIRLKLLFWFVSISLIPLAVVGWVVSDRAGKIIKESIKNELNISARGIEGKLSAFIEGKKNETVNFCSDGIIKDGLTYYDPEDPAVGNLVQDTNFHLTKNKMAIDPYLEDIIIINLKGKVIFSSNDKTLGKDKSKKDYFLAISKYFKDKEFLKKIQQNPALIVYATDFYISDDLKIPTLAISNIVTARATGLPLGVLVNRYKDDMLNSLLSEEGAAIGKTGKAYIVNKDGLLLTIPNFVKDKTKKYEVILKESVSTRPVTRAQTEGKETLGIYKDPNGKSVLGASLINKEKGWITIAEKDTLEAFAALRFLTIVIVSIAVVSIVIVILLSFLISDKITEPILKITQVAGKVAQGDFEAMIKYVSKDELGILVKDFNQMIQDLRRQRTQLLLDKEYINSIITDMLDSLIVIDQNSIIKTVNKATLDLLGYKEGELLGKPLEDVFEEEALPFKGEGLKKLIEDGFIRNYETAYKTKTNENVPVSLSGSVMYKQGKDFKEVIGIINVAHDMREIKELHSELLQCDKLASLGTLAAGVAHEIKNPLAIIIQGLAFLKSSIPAGDAIAIDTVERIERASMRAANIVRDLLSFSRQSPPALEGQDIVSVIEETLPLVEHQIRLKNIKVIRHFSPDLPLVKVDSNQIKQAFINIILNAVDAMPQAGTITIETEKPKAQAAGNTVKIRLSDTGCGIPEENLQKVFDPFFSTKQKQGGTGLGLSVTKGIIEGHSGTVEIESRLGFGTTVIVGLPIANVP